MRYYKISITDPKTGKPVLAKALGNLGLTSLLPNGQTNTAALNVELDIPVAAQHAPQGTGNVRIWGLDIAAVGSATNLNDCDIQVYGGMSKGLPLASPGQQGLLVQGTILQAYGNWLGTDMTVDLQISAGGGTTDSPLNIILDWKAGTTLESAIRSMLSVALPQAKVAMNINPNLVLAHDECGYYTSLTEFSKTIFGISKSIIKTATYPGVSISYNGAVVSVSDLTEPTPPILIQPQDLIGQPTWIGPATIQARFVLRGDLSVNDVVKLPTTLVQTQAAALTRFNQPNQTQTTFTGSYFINSLHHYGNFRQPDANSWTTVVEMTPYNG